MNTIELENLKTFCETNTQRNTFKTLISHKGSIPKTAKELNISQRAVQRIIKRVKDKAVLQGYSPEHDMVHTAPNQFFVKGVSTYYDKEGEAIGQWVKINVKQEQQFQAMKDAIEELMHDVEGKHVPSKEIPVVESSELLTVYPIGDAHVGMLAHHDESGENFDLKIAERDLTVAMKSLVASTPATKEALIVDVGDFFHSDSMDNATRKSGNHLDVDGRWHKVLKVGLRLMVSLVEEALTKHEIVKVINACGNHNEHSSVYISMFLDAWFKNEPRVIIESTPALHIYHRHGNVLIGVTHGHTSKANDLPEIMAHDCQDIWSDTKHRYWLTGHIHHDTVKEYRTCKVESFRTLAAKDAWHAGQGYRSGRDMKAIIYHPKYGEYQRHTVNIMMVHDLKS